MRKQVIRLLPNILSVLRIPLGGAFAFMLSIRFAGGIMPVWHLTVCFLAIALSDRMDGWISRRFDCSSDIGAVLDVSADSFFLLVTLIVSNCYDIVPVWFTVIVVLKLLDFILSSMIFSIGVKKHFVFDFLGRLTAVGFYLVPGLEVICPKAGIVKVAAAFLTFTAISSSMLRWLTFARQKSATPMKHKKADDSIAETDRSNRKVI